MIDFFKLIMQKKPLCYNLTNYVTANDCANVQLAIGAVPLMSLNKAESSDLLLKADSILLNIGTIDPLTWEAMHYVAYHSSSIPVILDPVGIMASNYRKKVVDDLLNSNQINILKGNWAELATLNGNDHIGKGVDSLSEDSLTLQCKTLMNLAQRYHLIVMMSGKADLITDGKHLLKIDGGNVLMTHITGAGCMLGALYVAFCGVGSAEQLFKACFATSCVWKLTAQKAATPLLGKMHTQLFDVLSTLSTTALKEIHYEILS